MRTAAPESASVLEAPFDLGRGECGFPERQALAHSY